MSDHDVLDRWRAADRVPGGIAHSHASRELMDQIRARIVVGERPVKESSRFRVRVPAARRGVALGSAVGLLLVGGAAAATVALTSTTIDGAAGSCQTLTNATANVPYPAGDQAWQNWVLLRSMNPKLGTTLSEACNDPRQQYVDKGASGTYGEMIPIYQGDVAESAFCAWSESWRNAEQSGDTTNETQAASEIAGALQWPAAQAFEQPQTATGPLTGGPQGLSWFSTAQLAVQSGNVAEVASMFLPGWVTSPYPIASRCSIYSPPANSDNGTVMVLGPVPPHA